MSDTVPAMSDLQVGTTANMDRIIERMMIELDGARKVKPDISGMNVVFTSLTVNAGNMYRLTLELVEEAKNE